MFELTEHEAYKLLKEKYDRVGCDYVILKSDEKYLGLESHKTAVIKAFEILNKRFNVYDCSVDIETAKMSGVKIHIDELLELPSDTYFVDRQKRNRSYSVTKPIPYWYAFFEPPFGTKYKKADFIAFNDILFPNKDTIEIYRWNDDFSTYFDSGKEWWGTGFWTIYDIKTGFFIAIGASQTD